MNRRLLLLPVLLLAALFAWRHFQAPSGDREVILGEIESTRRAAEGGNVSGILSRLDKSFQIQGASKSEIKMQLSGFFFTRGDVRLSLSGVDARVDGDGAASSGSYTLRWTSGPGTPEEMRSGNFSAQWKKIDGQWKITDVSGVDGLGGP